MGTGDWQTLCLGVARGASVPRALLAVLLLASCLMPARAQGVVEVLRQQRTQARLAEVVAGFDAAVAPLSAARLGAADPFEARFDRVVARRRFVVDSLRADSLAQTVRDSLAGTPDRLVWDKVEPDEQGRFLERYREVFWRASNPTGLALDTTLTPVLRGRLQSTFGRPTRNADAVRQVGYTGNEFVQFEYWFVVNDSIPLLLLDLDGPFGRGVLLAGAEAFADALPELRANLSDQLTEAPGPDPFVDYYHSFERRQWFRTGYNGTDYFTVPVRPPGWTRREAPDRWIIHR